MTFGIWQKLRYFLGGPRRSKKRISAKLRSMKAKAREELRATGARVTADLLAMQSSIEAIRSIAIKDQRRLAVVSILPPAESGIARFTLETFRRAGYAVDIFSVFNTPASFLNLFGNEKCRQLSVWHVETLPFAHHALRYDAVLVVLANSSHNVPVARALHEIAPMLGIPIFIQVHDPRLQNLAKSLYGEAFAATFSRVYEKGTPDLQDACVKMLIERVDVKGIIVHSDAARDIIVRDLGEKPPPIHKLFHPVFPSEIVTTKPNQRLTLGTFGVPGRAKCTTETLAAFRLIRIKYPSARLILAGFEADHFVRRNPEALPEDIEVYSSPSDAMLERLMSEVDVAVQLRSDNNGESSGVIPQLLCLGKPVVVSPVGAFNEYDSAVVFGPADNQPIGIASCIERVLQDRTSLDEAIARYTEKHTAGEFCGMLSKIIWPASHPDQIDHDFPNLRSERIEGAIGEDRESGERNLGQSLNNRFAIAEIKRREFVDRQDTVVPALPLQPD